MEWTYFTTAFTGWGYIDPATDTTANRNYSTNIRSQRYVDIKFTLTFEGDLFFSRFVEDEFTQIINTNALNTGLRINQPGESFNFTSSFNFRFSKSKSN